MNSQLLIDSIRTSNDFASIAQTTGMTIDDLKMKLIKLIDPTATLVEEIKFDKLLIKPAPTSVKEKITSDSSSEFDSEEEEDIFDRIIKKSSIKFSDEQIEFMRLAVKDRKSLSLLSPAGYGKSAIINTLVQLFDQGLTHPTVRELCMQYGKFCDTEGMLACSTHGLCASTGKAAGLINGRTFHSYFGIGMGRGQISDWVKRVSTAKYLRGTFLSLRIVQVIIIDEISMISAQLLDKISEYLQKIRRCDLPFGGIQMIFVGDMSQLSPVTGTFAFRSKQYKEAKVQKYTLTKCFRQSDPTFLKILDELRFGKCSDESYQILQARTSIDPEYSNGMQPLRLVSTNAEVDTINERELQLVCSETGAAVKSYEIRIGDNPKKAEACRKAEAIPEEVRLAIGAQIVVTHNISSTVYNGTQGQVIEFRKNEVVIKTVNGCTAIVPYISLKDPDHIDIYTAKSLLTYLPMRLGYASTIHKVQGASLTLVEVDLKRVFAHGQSYVAISRCTSLKGLIVKNFSKRVVICDALVKAFYGIE